VNGDEAARVGRQAVRAHEKLRSGGVDLRKLHRYGLETAARNRELIARHDRRYALELPFGHIENQHASGRCWLFSPMVLARAFALRRGAIGPDDGFSETFLHFFNLYEKAKASLRTFEHAARVSARLDGDTLRDRLRGGVSGLKDGGEWEWALFLVEKYGLCPSERMPETSSSSHSAELLVELHERLARAAHALTRKRGAAAREAVRARTLDDVVRILVAHLGVPPQHIEHRGRRLTPRDYARDVIGFCANEWRVAIASPKLRTGVVYRKRSSALDLDDGARFDLERLNVSVRRLRELVRRSIRLGFAVGFSADVGRNDIDDRSGIMHPRVFDRSKIYGARAALDAGRSLGRREDVYLGVSASSHAMAIVGFDVVDRRRLDSPLVKLRVVNSWGRAHGDHGIFHLYMPWFDENVFKIAVHESALSSAERAAFERPKAMTGDFY
jgi:bleomycin hydrolase